MSKNEDRVPSPLTSLNDDIGEERRLAMYRIQVEIREAEQRAFDLFLQNLVKGTSHLSLGQEACQSVLGDRRHLAFHHAEPRCRRGSVPAVLVGARPRGSYARVIPVAIWQG